MTRVSGVALDPESGAPRGGKLVTATIHPAYFDPPPAPIDNGVDRAITGADGSWELNLRPTVGTGAAVRIRVWDTETLYADVPAAAPGGAGDVTAIDVETILVDPDTLEPQDPDAPSLYLTRAERGQPNGVASLGADGKVPASQLPAGGGGEVGPLAFSHAQSTPSSVWLAVHNLGFAPAGVIVIDQLGHRHYPLRVTHPDPGVSTQLTFDYDVQGTVDLS